MIDPEEYTTVTEVNAGLLRAYADFLEASDQRDSKEAQECVGDIYEIAAKGHLILGGNGALDRINDRAKNLRNSAQGQDPYHYRQQTCEALMHAVIESSQFRIPWDAYLQTATRAQVWLAYLEAKRDEKEVS